MYIHTRHFTFFRIFFFIFLYFKRKENTFNNGLIKCNNHLLAQREMYKTEAICYFFLLFVGCLYVRRTI